MSSSLVRLSMPPLPVNANQNMWNLKPFEEKCTEYDKAFFDQADFMKRKIGCVVPVESHRVLLKAVMIPEKTRGGIFLNADQKMSGVNYDVGLVIGIGPEAFKDRAKFPYGPRCKIGDWVDFAQFEKRKKIYNGYLCFVVEDDRIDWPLPIETLSAVVPELKSYTAQQIEDLHEHIDITIENKNK